MRLTAQQQAELSRLLDEALSLDAAARERWLEALSPAHRHLLPQLRHSLVPERFPVGDDPMTYLRAADATAAPDSASGLRAGARVGPYELVRLLGAGGMAEVWLARRADGVFRREVALKLPLLARARRELEQRFARERDILANLEHPNIARLYDAGIDPDGLPYLSMEYIQGQPLTAWCDRERLSVRARLELFLQVLGAVQFAHERSVIHRDLKPSNILVTHAGQARLLDFGVAILLEDPAVSGHEPLTKVYGHAITPVYASPELVRGETVDARSDLYSLGVVLYEVLTGERPYRINAGAGRSVVEQAILAAAVPRPSISLTHESCVNRAASHEQLHRQLKGDLDLIVLKALSKAPEDRYDSAAAFADDLRRHLGGLPVLAQTPRFGYRAGKCLRRHRAAAAASLAAAAVLLVAGVYEFERAHENRMRLSAPPAIAFSPSQIRDKSIAVLPFIDLSAQQDQGYFCDGLSEELISSLAQIKDLEVIARTSSFHFRGKQDAMQEIASTLRVASVLEGSVRRIGDSLRVSAQLIRTNSGVHIWSQTFDRDVKDVFQVQDEIAAAVVAALKLQLLPAPHIDLHRSDNPEAYNQFLLARQYGRRGDAEDTRRAVAAYTRATQLDPNFAAAYAGLSFARTAIANATQDSNDFAIARAAADRAIALVPQLTDAYRARSLNRLETLDFAGARADAEQAISLAPGESAVQSLYGAQSAAAGKLPQAIAAMNRAIELDPLSGYAWASIGLFLTDARDYAGARTALERALAINPANDSYHMALGQLDLLERKFDDALGEYLKQGDDGVKLMGAALVEHARLRARESSQALRELTARHAADMAYQIAEIHAWRGDNDAAFEWLERALQQRDSGLNGTAYDPLLHGLRSDPRYTRFLTKLRL